MICVRPIGNHDLGGIRIVVDVNRAVVQPSYVVVIVDVQSDFPVRIVFFNEL